MKPIISALSFLSGVVSTFFLLDYGNYKQSRKGTILFKEANELGRRLNDVTLSLEDIANSSINRSLEGPTSFIRLDNSNKEQEKGIAK
jgi:hypothetical protein